MEPTPSPWQDCLDHAALSDVGLRRANNQDSMAVMLAPSPAVWQQRGHLFMVADGMGAHAAGELASKLAVDQIPLVYHKLTDRPAPQAVLAAVQDTNTHIHNRGQASPEFKGMGTTCTTLLLLPQGAVVAHVGDSRAYRLRGDRLEQLSFDHSLVWEMRAAGQAGNGPVPDYIPKNVITRSLGPNPSVQVDLEGPFPLAVGDTFLLCSDGLSGPVKDDEIGAIMGCLTPKEAVQALVDLACLRGGPDNITVIIARVTGAEMTGARANGEAPRQTTPGRPVHPALWALLGVFALVGLGLAAAGQVVLAAISFLIAALAGGIALFQRYGGRQAAFPANGQRLGRGPYVALNAAPTPELVQRLADIVRDLRDAAAKEGWGVDWHRLNSHVDQAVAAARTGDHCQAVRQYGQAISFAMAELRKAGK